MTMNLSSKPTRSAPPFLYCAKCSLARMCVRQTKRVDKGKIPSERYASHPPPPPPPFAEVALSMLSSALWLLSCRCTRLERELTNEVFSSASASVRRVTSSARSHARVRARAAARGRGRRFRQRLSPL